MPYYQHKYSGGYNNSKSNTLREGHYGLLFSFEGEPGRAIKEGRRVIERYYDEGNAFNGRDPTLACDVKDLNFTMNSSDQMCEKKSETSEEKKDDISDLLSKACGSKGASASFESKEKDRWPRDKWCQDKPDVCLVETGVKQMLFFALSEGQSPQNNRAIVYGLTNRILDATEKEGSQCRFLARMTPIERIISAHNGKQEFTDEFSKFVGDKLKEYLITRTSMSDDESKQITYSVEFSHRNSKLLERQAVYDLTNKVIQQISPGSAVSLEHPDFVIIVQVIRSLVLLSAVDGRRYISTRRYAIRPAMANATQSKAENCTDIDKDLHKENAQNPDSVS